MPGDEARPGAAPVPDEAEESVPFETPDTYGAYPACRTTRWPAWRSMTGGRRLAPVTC